MRLGVIISRERLLTVREGARSLRSSLAGSRKKTDTELVNMIVESERLKANIKLSEALVALIERGLASLTPTEREVLEEFYMKDSPPDIVNLKSRIGYETRSVYRLRDSALMKFTCAMYGITES